MRAMAQRKLVILKFVAEGLFVRPEMVIHLYNSHLTSLAHQCVVTVTFHLMSNETS